MVINLNYRFDPGIYEDKHDNVVCDQNNIAVVFYEVILKRSIRFVDLVGPLPQSFEHCGCLVESFLILGCWIRVRYDSSAD